MINLNVYACSLSQSPGLMLEESYFRIYVKHVEQIHPPTKKEISISTIP